MLNSNVVSSNVFVLYLSFMQGCCLLMILCMMCLCVATVLVVVAHGGILFRPYGLVVVLCSMCLVKGQRWSQSHYALKL